MLIAATTLLILTAQRYFQTGTPSYNGGRIPAPAARRLSGAQCVRRGYGPAGPRSVFGNPLTNPLDPGWKDILWRTYQQIGREDRLLAIAAGVVFFGLLAFFPP